MVSRYKITTEDNKKGVWISELTLIKIIQMSYTRNKKICKSLIEDYEYLEGKKFDYNLIGDYTNK